MKEEKPIDWCYQHGEKLSECEEAHRVGPMEGTTDRIRELEGYIQYLIDRMDLPEGRFTFPAGETWEKSE